MTINLSDPLAEADSKLDRGPRWGRGPWVALVIVILVAAGTWLALRSVGGPGPSRRVAIERPAQRAASPRAEPAPPEPSAPPAVRRRGAPRPAAPEPEPLAAPAATSVDRGSLDVQSDVDGASVFVDRVYRGVTPLTVADLTPGSHQVNVSAEGFEGIARTLDVAPGGNTLVVRFREVTLDASIAVVHKHGMGSCEGRLLASPQGVRYETDHRQDAFTIPLAELAAFEVDYMKKNLKLQRRGGKTYNFTDRQGNADALFVFHRDVEKARARLAGEAPAR